MTSRLKNKVLARSNEKTRTRKRKARPQMNERSQNQKMDEQEPQGSNQTGSWKEQFTEWSKHVPLRHAPGDQDGKRAASLAE